MSISPNISLWKAACRQGSRRQGNLQGLLSVPPHLCLAQAAPRAPSSSGWLAAFPWGHLCMACHCLARCKPDCGACSAGHILECPRWGPGSEYLSWVLKVALGPSWQLPQTQSLKRDCSGGGGFGSILLVGSCGKLELKAQFCKSGHSLHASGLGFISRLGGRLFSMVTFVNRLMTSCAKHVLYIELFGFTALACEERVMFVFPISWKESSDLLFKKHSCKTILL